MRKIVKTNEKMERYGWHFVTVTSLALTLAAFGCTMNRYPGSGQPTSVSPSYGTEGVPPMASSYTGVPRDNVDALATLAAEQGFRGRILGPVNPAGVQTEIPVQPTGGQMVPASLIVNPQATVNTSISSSPVPVITAGTAGNGVTIATAPTAATGGATRAGTTAVASTPATAGAAIPATAALTTSTGAGVPLTSANGPTVAGNAFFSPALMASTPSPSATGGLTQTLPTMTATGRAVPVSNKTGSSSTKTSMTASLTTKSGTVSAPMTMGFAPIRIETGAKGQITVTNASAAPTTTVTPAPAPTRY